MRNLININSSNIQKFGFTSTFDLLAKTLTLDISALTVFNTGGAANVAGIAFSITDPSGLVLASIDFTAPAIDPDTQTTYVVNLVGGFAIFGYYKITGVIQDADGKQYFINLIKKICQPDGFINNGYVPGIMDIIADCDVPKLTITDLTAYLYNNGAPETVTKNGTLSYPPATLADLAFTFTPFDIEGQGNVFTGRHTLNASNVASYNLDDGVYLLITYKVSGFEKVITCTSALATILCCIENLDNEYQSDPYSSTGKAIKTKLDKIYVPFMLAIAKEKGGKDASDEVAQIADILGCDCECSSNTIEPKAVSVGGLVLSNLNIVGLNAAGVNKSTTGSTVQYTINVKNIVVENGNDDASFTINKVVTGSTITYSIILNMPALASAILEVIQNDDELTALLRAIVGASNSGVSLDGLNGGCIISLTNCSYNLIEANNVPKTVVSVVIGSTTYNAPSSTLLSSTSAVQTWLNGLGKGTFVVALDMGSNTITISSTANANQVKTLNMTTSTGPLIRQFSRTCIGLVDFLNAIVSYICAIDTTRIKFGVPNKILYSFNTDGSVASSPIDPTITLSTLLSEILMAQGDLFTQISAVSLTCAHMKALFQPSTATLITTDGLFGLKNDLCARVTYDDLAGIVLSKISNSATLKNTLCAINVGCTGLTCDMVTNPTAALASGTLTVNCNNNGGGTTPIKILYRIYNSGNAFIEADTTAAALPIALGGGTLTSGQYEVQISKQCANTAWSNPATVITANGCVAPQAFTVTKTGGNFVVNVTLTNPQTKVQIRMTDPNGGVTNTTHDFGTGVYSGTFNIAVPTGLYGNYSFSASAICDTTVVPIFQSAFTSPVNIKVLAPSNDVVNARLSTTEAGACAASPRLLFVAPGNTIQTGTTVYYNTSLTVPVSDNPYIVDDATGNLFNLGTNGVIGTELAPC